MNRASAHPALSRLSRLPALGGRRLLTWLALGLFSLGLLTGSLAPARLALADMGAVMVCTADGMAVLGQDGKFHPLSDADGGLDPCSLCLSSLARAVEPPPTARPVRLFLRPDRVAFFAERSEPPPSIAAAAFSARAPPFHV